MRPISDIERRVIDRLLSIEFPGVSALRAQAEHLIGAEPWCTCGCPSITVFVDCSAAAPAPETGMVVEMQELARSDGIPREVMCFVGTDGYLATIECVCYGDPPYSWPHPDDCDVWMY